MTEDNDDETSVIVEVQTNPENKDMLMLISKKILNKIIPYASFSIRNYVLEHFNEKKQDDNKEKRNRADKKFLISEYSKMLKTFIDICRAYGIEPVL